MTPAGSTALVPVGEAKYEAGDAASIGADIQKLSMTSQDIFARLGNIESLMAVGVASPVGEKSPGSEGRELITSFSREVGDLFRKEMLARFADCNERWAETILYAVGDAVGRINTRLKDIQYLLDKKALTFDQIYNKLCDRIEREVRLSGKYKR
jgi:hypothetical protein